MIEILIKKTIFVVLLFSLFVGACTNRENKKKKLTKRELEQYDKSLVAVNKYLVTLDAERIQSYAKRHGWEIQQTETGLWYSIYENSTGEKAEQGKIATINYKVSLMDGTLCYSSDSLGPKTFLIGRGGVESGLEEGILLMKKHEKARLIMPPFKAHGLLGDMNKIPARATVIFDIKLLNLSDNN